MSGAPAIAVVALLGPLRASFDYLIPQGLPAPQPGQRVAVPFGRGQRIGIALGGRNHSAVAVDKLKPLTAVLDDAPLIDAGMLELAQWAANYYQHPLGEVLAALLPTRLRRRGELPRAQAERWQLSPTGVCAHAGLPPAAVRQRGLLASLASGPSGAEALAATGADWRRVLGRLLARGWVVPAAPAGPVPASLPATPVTLNQEQQHAAELIARCFGTHRTVVLHGVTGSGKTEVYFDAIARCLAVRRQALVLLPEIALTRHLLARFGARFGARVGALHSGLAEGARLATWAACRRGDVGVLVGTRSAVWAPLPALGLVVVDEEHDPSYKQQDGFRYSARDIAIVRAQRQACPVVLGSATPALETLANLRRGKYREARLHTRAVATTAPELRCIDVRGLPLEHGLSDSLLTHMREVLARGEQVMLLINRRGYAPLLMCRSCGKPRRCDRCDAYLVLHKADAAAHCHHCDRRWPLRRPAGCCATPQIDHIGLGTESIEEGVQALFPTARVLRVDRDSVRRKDTMDEILRAVTERRVDILIGTQMLAKGFDFAGITLVGVVDTDSRLYSVDFRAEERLAQLLVQVAGRAGRAAQPGRVLVQTHHPDHAVLRRIIEHGYDAYAEAALTERKASGLPPFSALALLRADSARAGAPLACLAEIRSILLGQASQGLDISFPLPALMERRAGRYRALIVLNAARRATLGELLAHALGDIDAAARRHRVRWSVDVDPQDTL